MLTSLATSFEPLIVSRPESRDTEEEELLLVTDFNDKANLNEGSVMIKIKLYMNPMSNRNNVCSRRHQKIIFNVIYLAVHFIFHHIVFALPNALFIPGSADFRSRYT